MNSPTTTGFLVSNIGGTNVRNHKNMTLFAWVNLCCLALFVVASGRSEKLENRTKSFEIDDEKLIKIFVEYFRFHGVRSLNFVLCPADFDDAPNKRLQLLSLTQNFILNGFYTRIFNGNNYMPDNEDFKSPYPNPAPITFRSDNFTTRRLRFWLPSLAHKTGVLLLQFNNECALNLLRWSAATEHSFLTPNCFWLLLANDLQHVQLLQDGEIFLPPDSEVKILINSSNRGPESEAKYSLIDVYKVNPHASLKQRYVCTEFKSTQEMILALRQFGSAISYRYNLEGTVARTALVIAFPDLFTNIEDLSMRHIDTISKVNNRLTIELANKLNLSFNTYQTDNYGWRKPNGSFDGLMGMFQRYELDFAQMAIFMRLERVAVVDFAAETFRVRAGIMFRQPPLSAVANIFAMPFEDDVWISILIIMIFTIAVFLLELLFSPHSHDMDFLDCVIFVWGAACQQGFYVTVGNISARVIVFTTFVTTLFLFTSFSANIVALLQSPSEAIHSLSDLTLSPLEIGVQDTQYNKIFFNESTDPVTNQLFHKKIAPKGDRVFMRAPLGIEKMRTGLFAYQVELQAGYQIVSDTFSEPEKCGLKELEPFQLPMISIPTKKNFPYKELFRRQLRWQREVGLMNREELKWFPQKPKCEAGVGGFVSIGLTECRYALAMFGFGILAGFIMFWFEFAYHRLLPVFKRLAEIKHLSSSPY